MPNYDELKQRLEEIADILKKFPETVQPQVYELLIGAVSVKDKVVQKPQPKPRTMKEPKMRVTGKSKETYTLLKNLDFKRGEGKQSFEDFIAKKKPASAIEFNTVSAFYLSEVIELDRITPDHIYTCYAEVKRRSPDVLSQSLRDTSGRRYGYLDIADDGIITIPLRGKNFVEHDLQKKKEISK